MKKFIILFFLLQMNLLYSSPGDLLWRYKTSERVLSSPVVANNIVYFGSNDKNFYALNAQNGSIIWGIQIGTSIWSRPFVKDGVVYYAGFEPLYIVRAHNANSGTRIWEFETSSNNYSSPVVFNGILYVGSNDKHLYAINTSDGSLKWKYLAAAEVGTPCIWETKGLVYFGIRKHTTAMKSLFALDAESGNLSWEFDTNSYVYGPFFSNGNIYSTSTTSGVFANNATNGELIWAVNFGYPKYIWSNAFVSDGLVFFGCQDDNVYCLDEKTGSQKWSYKTGGDIDFNPIVEDKVVYINSRDEYLYALDFSNGNLKWRYRIGRMNESSPYVANSIVYVGSEDTYLYAIETYGYAGFSNYKTSKKSIPEQFDAAPNPCKDYLILSLPKDTQIYSLSGQLIRKLAPGKYRIETKNWITGIYIIKSGEETRKIIKYN